MELLRRESLLCRLVAGFLVALALMMNAGVFGQGVGTRYVVGVAVVRSPRSDCPCFVSRVTPKSPAAAAGITGGDRLLAIDQAEVNGSLTLPRIMELLSSNKPGGVTLKLWRKSRTYDVALEREQMSAVLARQGMKVAAQGLIVPSDSSEAEIERLTRLMSNNARLIAHLFPAHVPLNNDLFHGGFALLIYRDPGEVVTTGVEDGPASRAGLRQGDTILSINETELSEKTAVQIEALFSGNRSELVRLTIDRGGTRKTLEYRTEKVSEILKANQLRLSDGQVVPLNIADEDIPCYLGKQP